MHELSHGDKSSTKRFEKVVASLFILSSFFFMLKQHHIAYFIWIVSACIGLFISYSQKIEPKAENERENERKTVFKPAYGVERAKLLVMLRNIETEKRKRV